MRLALYDGIVNTERFVDFLQDFVVDSAGRKAHLVVENLRVQAWHDDRPHLIDLHCRPPCSPEANPDELFNHDLKTKLCSRPAAKDTQTPKAMGTDFMHKLVALPERVKRYVQSHSTAYAAASASVDI